MKDTLGGQVKRIKQVFGSLFPIFDADERNGTIFMFNTPVEVRWDERFIVRPLVLMFDRRMASVEERVPLSVGLAIACFNGRKIGLDERTVSNIIATRYWSHMQWQMPGGIIEDIPFKLAFKCMTDMDAALEADPMVSAVRYAGFIIGCTAGHGWRNDLFTPR